jgi:hypothetical protein
MAISKYRLLVLTGLLIFFVIGGLYGTIAVKMIQSDKVFFHSLWFAVPSLPIAIYYAYRSTFGYDRKTALWRNVLGTVVLSIVFLLILLKTFQGYLNIYNCTVGRQRTFLFKGHITNIEEPRRKGRLFSVYKIEVIQDSSQKRLKLDTKRNDYQIGQSVEMEMRIGSLGYIYTME